MSELALYRKYRSATFDSVAGQPHIVQTLKNVVETGRYSHAYLFTGPRGVGKTSVARLLARSANCTGGNEATAKPCNTCDNCRVEIGSHLDLIEIDAASHRGIDDARDLREKIGQGPSMGAYKVYIIDEVHMLTTEAFNALLKTLEEPPKHAMFILATTELHKLPETIISRTQHFAFRPITLPDLVSHLEEIAAKENISTTDEAIALIAQASRGGFRDAISLLDQLASSGDELTAEMVRSSLGWTNTELIDKVIAGIINHSPSEALQALDTAISQGAQPGQLANQLLGSWRARLRELVASKSSDMAAITIAVTAIEQLSTATKSAMPDLALEAAVVRLCLGDLVSLVGSTKSTAPSVQASFGAPSAAPKSPSSEAPIADPQRPAAGDNDLWVKALAQIKQRNNSLYALLRSCTVTFEENQLIIGCKFGFFRDRLKESKNIQTMEQALARVYGRKLRVVPQLELQPQTVPNATPPVVENSSELMGAALEILGGEVVSG